MKPKVACVILNWNGCKDTIACLHSLERTTCSGLRTIVVDNASSDDSVLQLRKQFPELLLLQNDTNAGFAAGNNLGIRRALEEGHEYIWLLNNDTEPAPEALTRMVEVAESNRRIGAVGSVLFYHHNPTQVQTWGGGRVNLWLGLSDSATDETPDSWFDYMTAASMLVRREVFLDVGLLDETFFLYWEDTDFGLRLRKNGWTLGVAKDAHVLHKENASTGGVSKTLDYFATDSGIRFLRKHAPAPPFAITAFLLRRILMRVVRGQLSAIPIVLRGWLGSRQPERIDPSRRG